MSCYYSLSSSENLAQHQTGQHPPIFLILLMSLNLYVVFQYSSNYEHPILSLVTFLYSRFTTPHHKEGFELFLDTIVAMEDVWVVTAWQTIQWMRNPADLDNIDNFKPFQCDYKVGFIKI